MNSLERAADRTFTEAERATITDVQARAYRRAFIVLGVENAGFIKYLEQFSVGATERVASQLGALS